MCPSWLPPPLLWCYLYYSGVTVMLKWELYITIGWWVSIGADTESVGLAPDDENHTEQQRDRGAHIEASRHTDRKQAV
jgi:hypothetical protein